jgi:hypothetical protein
MKYEAFTVQCKWFGEEKGGFVGVRSERRFEEQLTEFCDATGMVPTGGVSVAAWGTTLLVTQMCFKPGAAKPGAAKK